MRSAFKFRGRSSSSINRLDCAKRFLAAAGIVSALVAPGVMAASSEYKNWDDNDNNLHTGIADNDLQVPLTQDSEIAPIEFNIGVTGALPVHDATLSIKAYDIDATDVATVYLNGVVVGMLTGISSEISVTKFDIPIAMIVAGANQVEVQFESQDFIMVWGGILDLDQCEDAQAGCDDTGGGDTGGGDTGGGDTGGGDTGGGDTGGGDTGGGDTGGGDTGGGDTGGGDTGGGDTGGGDTGGGDTGGGDTGGGDTGGGDTGGVCGEQAASLTNCDGGGTGIDTDGDGVDDDIDLDDDNDGISDFLESDGAGNDVDTDGDGTPDRLDLDTDNDTLSDETESGFPALTGSDANHNGLDDAVDAEMTGGVDANHDGSDDVFVPRNTDDDPLPDFRDPNSDNDDLPDADENGDFDNNGVPDYLEARGRLETAVRGAGSSGVVMLAVLAMFAALRRRKGAAAVLALLASFTASADQQVCSEKADFDLQFPQCWYIGLGIGESRLNPDDDISEWSVDDKSDFAYKGTLGYHFLPHFFAEASFADLGGATVHSRNPAVTQSEFVNYKTPSAMLGYLLLDPASRWNFFAKIGAARLDTDSPGVVNHKKDTSVQLAVAGGVQLRFAERWFARAEVDSYDKDARAAFLSINRYFGESKAAPRVVEPAPVPAPVAAPVVAQAPAKPACKQFSGVIKDVNFETASAELGDTSKSSLNNVVSSLNEFPDMKVDIAAHTDARGTDAYNMRLGQRRADSVVGYLQSGGIASQRMQAKSFGESQPVADNTTDAGRALNRRVEIHPQNTQQCVPSAP